MPNKTQKIFIKILLNIWYSLFFILYLYIRALDSSLNKIKLLNPVIYDYKKDFFPDLSIYPELSKTINSQDRFNRAGLIAQEAKEVIPQIVHHDEDKDIYGIDYVALVPYLIGAVQEQQTQIESLQNIINSQVQELVEIKDFTGYAESALKKSTIRDPLENSTVDNVPILYQNTPNPFFDITIIEVFLPEKVQTAKLYIHNLNGIELMIKDLSDRGDLKITIDGSSLKKGMYLYTLTVDGTIIDSKRMILTE